ncbi:MAG TPA: class I SAM-dependent methyltransferase, partial [Chloroflexia bacterium]|nr:class I SAM-dependent methyltransferase [Chloroflexia bacterium]
MSTAASVFSRAAPLYDAEHTANPLARWTRARSLAVLDAAFGPGDRVLETGCGTGAEALHLAA